MNKMPSDWKPRRVQERVAPSQISPEEKARLKAESDARYQLARAVFERIRPNLIKEHYNWYITIEPNSGNYFIDEDDMVSLQKLREKHPHGRVVTFRLNETGTCGSI